ncbi:MAG: class I SAM-dependent methyltransferase, partial [Methyloligellaceae bacterium]
MGKLKRRIASEGAITLAQYIEACLSDPDHGYYATRDPFGAEGDFTTAPEISQIFGELIGLWCVAVWQDMGQPSRLRLAELGPGRGTLMADALRAAALVPEFLKTAEIHLVETSPVLRGVQAKQLEACAMKPFWHDKLGDVPESAAILIANEFLDALPVRQFMRREGAWFERCVDVSDEGGLAFCLASEALETPDMLPQGVRVNVKDGDIAEIRPGADALVEDLAVRAENYPLAALFIDYGHRQSAPGETL